MNRLKGRRVEENVMVEVIGKKIWGPFQDGPNIYITRGGENVGFGWRGSGRRGGKSRVSSPDRDQGGRVGVSVCVV